MKRKTVSNILKGVATAGVVLGGANLADEIGVVYAEEENEGDAEDIEQDEEAVAVVETLVTVPVLLIPV